MFELLNSEKGKPFSASKAGKNLEAQNVVWNPDQRLTLNDIRLIICSKRPEDVVCDTASMRYAHEKVDNRCKVWSLSECKRFWVRRDEEQDDTAKAVSNELFGLANCMIQTGNYKWYNFLVPFSATQLRVFTHPESSMQSLDLRHDKDLKSAMSIWNTFLRRRVKGELSPDSNYVHVNPPRLLSSVLEEELDELSELPITANRRSVAVGCYKRLGACKKTNDLPGPFYIGVAFSFKYRFFEFFRDNICVLERELVDLQSRIFSIFTSCAYVEKQPPVYRACRTFFNKLMTFHSSCRLYSVIPRPLEVVTLPEMTPLLKGFCDAYDYYETKERGFFLSQVVSAVLMYHLTWVSTTDRYPVNHPISENVLLNAFGCVGSLSHTARVVFVGKDNQMLVNILQFISFFVRFRSCTKYSHLLFPYKPEPEGEEGSVSTKILIPSEEPTISNLVPEDGPTAVIDTYRAMETIGRRWQTGEFAGIEALKLLIRDYSRTNYWEYHFGDPFFETAMRRRSRSDTDVSELSEMASLNIAQEPVRIMRPRSNSNPVASCQDLPFASQDVALMTPIQRYTRFCNFLNIERFAAEFEAIAEERYNDDHDEDFIEFIPKWSAYQVYKEAKDSKKTSRRTSEADSGYGRTSPPSHARSPRSPINSNAETKPSGVTELLTVDYPTVVKKRSRKTIESMAEVYANLDATPYNPTNPDEYQELYRSNIDWLNELDDVIKAWENVHFEQGVHPADMLALNIGAALTPSFQPHFVLQGIDANSCSAENVGICVATEIHHPETFYITVQKEEKDVKKKPKIPKVRRKEKPEYEVIQLTSVIVVADMDARKIQVHSGDVHNNQTEDFTYVSGFVQSLLERARKEASTSRNDANVFTILSEGLECIVQKSEVLHRIVHSQHIMASASQYLDELSTCSLDVAQEKLHNWCKEHFAELAKFKDSLSSEKVAHALQCDFSDLRLMVNVASVSSLLVRLAACR